ncbi:uncharacterized protein BYT42DRAFT_558940 [Radiomyces spectabilis]|uniref:uncharacterized protein n=1 Tax=Radiomyces spectabilis TaxID=64574 RepID=UPI00221F499F|nr:uncharacterized protein BYT42DRAFT_558940 [Radiomyces spectabilis]KAI8388102.1 hypothetical protein BYT42DRAFT_558940 [Radiomyces spectabilis]
MATVEELISLQHSIYKELKACLEPEEKARIALQNLETKYAENNEVIQSLQNSLSQLKQASKCEYRQVQNLQSGILKCMFHSHKVKVEEQKAKHRKAFQAEKEAVVQLEKLQAEKEKLRKKARAAKAEHELYLYQRLQLNRFITNIFREAINVEDYPELTALTEKIKQENQAKSRCHTELVEAEEKKSDISDIIQSLEKANKALTLDIDTPTCGDILSSEGDHGNSVKSAKQHVERAIHLLQAQGATKVYMVEALLNSAVLQEDTFWGHQSEHNEERRVQLQLWEDQIRETQKEMQINLLLPLIKQVNDLQRQIRNHDDIITTLKDDIVRKQQQILDDILSDIPEYQPTGAPPPYMPELTTYAV